MRSVISQAGTAIDFVNRRNTTVVVDWLNYRGARVHYAVLKPGQTYRQETFVGHPWVVTDLRGRALTIVLPASQPDQAEIL